MGSCKNDITRGKGEGGRGLPKMEQKVTNGGRRSFNIVTVTHSLFYSDDLFYLFISLNHISSCLLYHLFHVLMSIKN